MVANLKLAISTWIKFSDSDFIPKFENLSPIISEGIFNFGFTLKKTQTKSLALNFSTLSKELRDSDLVHFFKVPNWKYLLKKIHL